MYCDNCGVELEPGVEQCPLCGSGSPAAHEPELREYAVGEPEAVLPAVRRLFRRGVGAAAATVAAVLLIVDVGTTGGVSWSPLAITPVFTAAAILVVAATSRRWWPGFFGAIAAIIAMLALLDVLANGVFDWFVPLATPLVLATAVLIALERRAIPRVRGVLRGAAIFAGAGVLTAVIDAVVAWYADGTPRLSWSLVVLVSTLPTAGLLVILHRTVLRYVDLRRRFHV